MRTGKRWLAMALSLLMLMMTSALADVPLLVHSSGWRLEDTPVEVRLSAGVDTHMPFDSNRLTMLTPITDALSLRIVAAGEDGLVAIALDDQELLSLRQRGNAVQLSCLPEVTYTAAMDPLSLLLGADLSVRSGYELLGLSPKGESLITDGRALLAAVPEAFAEHGRKSKNQLTISGYGKAEYMVDYAFTAKQTEDFKSLLLAHCPEGWLREIISGLTFSGKQTVRMYFTAQDEVLRMEYNGSCGPDGDLRTVKLVYKMRNDDTVTKDYIELTSPAKKGTNKNTLTFDRTMQINAKGERVLSGTFKYSATQSGVSSVTNGDFSLRNTPTGDADQIVGSLSVQTRLNGAEKISGISLAPNLTISGTQEEPVINGIVDVTEQFAGKTTEHAVVRIALKKAEPLIWTERASVQDLSAMSAQDIGAVQQQVASAVATTLIRPIIVRFGKDAQWFFRDLPKDAIQAIIDAATLAVQE